MMSVMSLRSETTAVTVQSGTTGTPIGGLPAVDGAVDVLSESGVGSSPNNHVDEACVRDWSKQTWVYPGLGSAS